MELRGLYIVTGGGSGLGWATASALSAAGARVAVWDRDDAAGRVSQLADAHFERVDITDEAGVSAALKSAVDWAGGGPRGLVTCAGIISSGRVVGRNGPHPLDAFRRVIEVNLLGTFNCVRLVAQAMSANTPEEAGPRSGERGCIVMVSSIAAYEGQVGQAAYAASKGGVASLALTCARDLAGFGIRCSAIAPGLFRTSMVAGLDAEIEANILRSVPFPSRLGDPADFASLALEILRNPFLNGGVIRLDGAARMPAR